MLGLIILILISSALSGCFGKSESKDKNKKQTLYELTGEYPSETGWVQSEGDPTVEAGGIYLEARGSISIILNNSDVFAATIELSFDDYDEAHSGSDGASPADEVEVSLTVPGFNESESGTTPRAFRFELIGNNTGGDIEPIPSEITFDVYAKCWCEIVYPMTGRPSLFFRYMRDQGVAYEITAAYQYYSEESGE